MNPSDRDLRPVSQHSKRRPAGAALTQRFAGYAVRQKSLRPQWHSSQPANRVAIDLRPQIEQRGCRCRESVRDTHQLAADKLIELLPQTRELLDQVRNHNADRRARRTELVQEANY